MGGEGNNAPYPALKAQISVIPAQAGTQIHAPSRIKIAPTHQSLAFDELGSSLRWNDDLWRIMGINLSPPPPAARILQLFRSHWRHELSHSRRSGACSLSGRRGDIPSAGRASIRV